MNVDSGSLFALLAIGGFFVVFLFLALGIVLYILGSLGLYRLAMNQKIENPWLAWIPVAELYIVGKLIKNLKIDSLEIPRIELVLPIGCLAVGILSNIPYIGALINLAYIILICFALYRLYKMYRPEQAVLWLVLSIVLPFMAPIFIFIMRNDMPRA